MPLSLFISEAKSKEMDRLMERRNAYEEASAEKGKLRTNRSDYSLCSLSNELVAQCCISTRQTPVFRHFNSVVLNIHPFCCTNAVFCGNIFKFLYGFSNIFFSCLFNVLFVNPLLNFFQFCFLLNKYIYSNFDGLTYLHFNGQFSITQR